MCSSYPVTSLGIQADCDLQAKSSLVNRQDMNWMQMAENSSVFHKSPSGLALDTEETMLNSSMGNTSNLTCITGGRHTYIFLMIPVIYSIIFVMGVLGNSMVIVVIYYYLKPKTVANIFLLNLALADLIFVITLPLWAAYTAMEYHWPFGVFLCKMSATILLLNMNASIFLITCLSIDRYLAIVHPMKSRTRRTLLHAWMACIMVWLLAGLASLPAMIFRDAFHYIGWNKTICAFHYPEEQKNQWIFGMALLKTFLGFLIPLLIIVTCYSLIVKSLVQAYQIEKSKPASNEAFKLIVAVVVSFILCWLPFQIFTFLDMLSRLKVIKNCHIPEIVDTSIPFTICVAYFNSCLNPILYGFVGRTFREKFFLLLRCMPPKVRTHPRLSTKMSSLSYHTVEILNVVTKKPVSSSGF
ncbi:type-1 angiotensin II receptor [Carcharodon carcharias]|uniref:type-1 angiotensin II receptor n=1 Tax=Carcharodon carcharias TaxID=13397 RepID=UPI001B7E3196|nr:type-1 angiotensin II receptor [Carcharodon carcharias]